MADTGGMLRSAIRDVWQSGGMPALITPTGRATSGEIERRPLDADLADQLIEHVFGTADLPSAELVELLVHPEDWNTVGPPEMVTISPYHGRESYMGVAIDYREISVAGGGALIGTPSRVAAA